MRGGFFAAAALALLEISCGGVTIRDPDRQAQGDPASPRGGSAPAGQGGSKTSGQDPPERCDCLPVTIRWWRAGGLAGPSREASIEPCAAFGYQVLGAENKRCTSTIEGCGDALGVDDISAALADPDVQLALEQAPIVYGRDLRPLDGHVDHIEVDGKVIEVGDECNGESPDCQLPLGIDRFGRLLGNLQFQEEARATCQVK